MRIGMIAPLELRVPPLAYGGTELIVSLLTEELVRRNHSVTLFASGDSCTSASLVAGAPSYLRGSHRNKGLLSILNVVSCLERSDDFDLIHNHTGLEGMATAGLIRTPVLTTLHGALEGDWLLLFQRYRGWYNTISESAKALIPPKDRFAGVIYNAIECETYPFNPGPRDDYLLFLSRISPEKGPHLAIEVARRLGQRLVIAGNVDSVDEQYFQSEIMPQVDGDLVHYVGEADYALKRELFSNARCLLAPITWDEPFGLFMTEAMACGTPVIAMRRGAAPELVVDGETGFLVDDVDEMAEAVSRIHTIDPTACRRNVEERFSVGRMVDDYIAAYSRITGCSVLPQELPPEDLFAWAGQSSNLRVLSNPFDSEAPEFQASP